ncbi:MAG: hypothetical protein FWF81_08245 [Defluviitaleaceae bacterium]|nr:hypothetical protein [Defluviitaleaceae bacterium]
MKKFWILALTLIVVLTLAACGGNDNDNDTPAPSPAPAANGGADAPADPVAPEAPTDAPEAPTVDEPETGNGVIELPTEDAPTEEAPTEDETEEPEVAVINVPARPADVLYSLSTDVYFQNMPSGTRGDSDAVLTTEYLMGSGSPTFRVEPNPRGGVALHITHREASYHAVDLVTSAMGLDTSANSYQLTVIGNISEAGNIVISGGDSPWTTLFSQAASAGDFTVQFVMTETTLENAGSRAHVRIGADTFGNMEIHEIEVRRVERVAPVVVPERPANVLYSMATDPAFQSKAQGLSGPLETVLAETNYLQNAGPPTGEIVANPAGGNSLLVSGRTADWHTVDFMLDNMGWTSAEYTVRVRGVVINRPEGEVLANIMATGGGWERFGGFIDVEADGSFVVEGVISQALLAENGGDTNRVRFAIGEAGETSDYILHEISITRN